MLIVQIFQYFRYLLQTPVIELCIHRHRVPDVLPPWTVPPDFSEKLMGIVIHADNKGLRLSGRYEKL